MTDWTLRARKLADQLAAAGKLRSNAWRQAVCAVPRHELVPVYYEWTGTQWERQDTTTPQGRQRWLELVYSNTALFTRPDGGSSSSMPGLMVRMLEDLDVREGQRVLEIGTGTGYNAALLCHRLGDQNVFSVDIEPDLVELARQRLAALNYYPTLGVCDGEQGLPEHALYDRIVATCSVPAVPWPWVQQTTMGGLILADLKLSPSAGNLVLLRRGEEGAEGRFDRQWGGFMPMRHTTAQAEPRPPRDRAHAYHRTTSLDLPRPWEHLLFWFFANLHLPPNVSHGQLMDPRTSQPGDSYLASADGSWCEISAEPESNGARRVWEAGPVPLWAQIEAAHRRWTELGEPSWERFGLTVTAAHQAIWLDEPHGPHVWGLPT